eukprot:9953591-Lingulodinium_polyedra.AAC.1
MRFASLLPGGPVVGWLRVFASFRPVGRRCPGGLRAVVGALRASPCNATWFSQSRVPRARWF